LNNNHIHDCLECSPLAFHNNYRNNLSASLPLACCVPFLNTQPVNSAQEIQSSHSQWPTF